MSSRMLRWVLVPIVALAFSGAVTAQEHGQPAKPEAKKEEPKKDEPKAKDIVEVAIEAKFNTLVDLVKAADLVETLKGKGPFTVFAPTDEAFAKLGKETLEDLKKPANKEKLANILKYHVVSGKVMAANVLKMDGKAAKTVEGGEIKIAVKDGKVTLDGKINVTKTDVAASNGVIHVIDGVLMPPAKPADKPAAPPAEPKPADKPAEKKPDAKPAEKPADKK